MSLKVAVVHGGPSSEAEVSRASAAAIAGALAEAGHTVARLELDAALPEALRTGGHDVVFPAVHGAVGEDGCLQGLLEILGLPYVGSGVLPSALAMDKAIARKVFAAEGLPIARGTSVARGGGEDERTAARRVRAELGRAVVVKPSGSGSAIGVTRVAADADDEEAAAAVAKVWELGAVAVVERFVVGREVTCGVLDVAGQARALPPTEIVAPKDAFYTYQARYAPGRSVHVCPAELGDARVRRVQELAILAHRALGCRDLSRVDFVVGDAEGDLVVLEVNTLPGFTGTSLYPEAAAVDGLAFPALCDLLVRNARSRGASARNAALPLPK